MISDQGGAFLPWVGTFSMSILNISLRWSWRSSTALICSKNFVTVLSEAEANPSLWLTTLMMLGIRWSTSGQVWSHANEFHVCWLFEVKASSIKPFEAHIKFIRFFNHRWRSKGLERFSCFVSKDFLKGFSSHTYIYEKSMYSRFFINQSLAQWGESFFKQTSVAIVIVFWLKWAGYLAVAGLNLQA